jgi:hypothetical protein
MTNRLDRRSFLLAAAATPLAVAAVAAPAEAEATTAGAATTARRDCPRSIPSGIQPLTDVTQNPRGGYYSDPYPIPWPDAGSAPPAFAGSPKSILSSAGPFGPASYDAESITITLADSLAAEAAGHGATFQPGDNPPNVWSENNNIAKDGNGQWQMATTLRVSRDSDPATDWTVIVHASPVGGTTDEVPTSWIADTLLVGSYDTSNPANYCGKYVENGGQLYLTYSDRLSPEPNATNGIVAQPMISATEPAGTDPTVLIHPEPGDGLKSELFFGLTQPPNFRITETGNVVRIGDIYVMTYSAGAFDRDTYKTGLAFSDTLLPVPGSIYQKLFQVDSDGVWGSPGATEVRYLLQAQQPNWPNYVAGQVLAPGVPSIRQVGDDWYLFFAAYDHDDAPVVSGNYDASYRRPYFMRLQVAIPPGATVSDTPPAELAAWITAA